MFSFSVAHQASFILGPSVKHLSFFQTFCFRKDRALSHTVIFQLWEFGFRLNKIFETLQYWLPYFQSYDFNLHQVKAGFIGKLGIK